jgi:hypothetical protein
MAETRGSIVCRLCGTGIVVAFHRVHGNGVHLAVADVAPLRAHYAECTGVHPGEPGTAMVVRPKVEVPAVDLAGRIEQLLNGQTPDGGRYFVATAGSRACTMCGMNGATCLALVAQNTRQPCCRACGDGNTHPAPGEAAGTCQQWAEDRESRAQD